MTLLPFVRRLPYWLRLIAALMVIVAPVAALCVDVAGSGYRSAEMLAVSQARSDATLVDVYLRSYFDKYLAILKTLAVEQVQGGASALSTADTQALLDRVALDHPRAHTLIALDGSGKVIASSHPEAMGLDCAQSEWWRRLKASRAAVVSDFESSPQLGGPVVVLAVPVPGGEGCVGLSLNTSTMSTVWEGLLPSGVVALTDRQGVPIVQSNLRDMTDAERLDLAQNSPIVHMVQQSSGVVTLQNVPGLGNGYLVIGAGLTDPQYGWSVIATQDRDQLLGPIRQEQYQTWLALAIILLISFAVAVLLIGRGPMHRVVLPEISGGGSLEVVFDHLREQANSNLYGEVQLRFRGGRIYKATISRERVFD